MNKQMDNYYIITFENTHGAISGESILKAIGINVVVMPTPTFITKSCGISLKVKEEDLEKVKELIKEEKLKIKGIYMKENSLFKVVEV